MIWNQKGRHEDCAVTGFEEYDAPEGMVWVCGACGKTARNSAEGGISSGWDESCFLNSVLCLEKRDASGNFVAVEAKQDAGPVVLSPRRLAHDAGILLA